MTSFLDDCTTFDQPERRAMRISLVDGDGLSRTEARRAVVTISRRFGVPRRRRVWAVGPGGSESGQRSWDLELAEIPPAMDLLDRLPVPRIGKVGSMLGAEIQIAADFRLRNPESGQVLENQGLELYGEQDQDWHWNTPRGISIMYLRLATRSTCNLVLSFPYQDLDPEAKRVIATIVERVPFRLSPHHWSRWQLNRAGTSWYKRKIPVPFP